MKRSQIAAYLTVVTGLASTAMYVIGHYTQAAYAYQIAKHIPPRVQEGSFWLTINAEPFLYPGIAFTIIGTALVLYQGTKSLNAQMEQRATNATS